VEDTFDENEYLEFLKQANEVAKTYEINRIQGKFVWDEEKIEEIKSYSLEELICDDYFLGLKNEIRPSILEDIYKLWEEKKKRRIHIVCYEEGIGSGKTFKASIILWLQWLEITLHESPQKHFGIEPHSRIAFVCSSRTEAQARKICFSKVAGRFMCPFNRDYFPPDPRYSNEIQIPRNKTSIYAGNSSALSVQGFDYYGGIMDECITDDYVWIEGFEKVKISELVGKKNFEIHNFNYEVGKFFIEPAVVEECVCLGERDVWELTFEDGDKVCATEDTMFLYKEDFMNRYFKKLKDIKEGDDICKVIRCFDQETVISEKIIKREYKGKQIVYDFKNVSPNHNFLVGEHGIVVHNCNSMQRTEDSKRAIGTNTVYDEAEELKDAILSRMMSRFQDRAGMLVCVSSATYDDDFLRRLEKAYYTFGDESLIYFQRRMLSESFYLSDKLPFKKYNKNVESVFPEEEGYFYIDLDSGKEVSEEVAQIYFEFVNKLREFKKSLLRQWRLSEEKLAKLKNVRAI